MQREREKESLIPLLLNFVHKAIEKSHSLQDPPYEIEICRLQAAAIGAPEIRGGAASFSNGDSLACCAAQINEQRGPDGMDEVRKAYEFTLDKIGSDIGAGPLWQEYIAFLQVCACVPIQQMLPAKSVLL